MPRIIFCQFFFFKVTSPVPTECERNGCAANCGFFGQPEKVLEIKHNPVKVLRAVGRTHCRRRKGVTFPDIKR
jgi:hypothetical protein